MYEDSWLPVRPEPMPTLYCVSVTSTAPRLFQRNEGIGTFSSLMLLVSVWVFEALCSKVRPMVCSPKERL